MNTKQKELIGAGLIFLSLVIYILNWIYEIKISWWILVIIWSIYLVIRIQILIEEKEELRRLGRWWKKHWIEVLFIVSILGAIYFILKGAKVI